MTPGWACSYQFQALVGPDERPDLAEQAQLYLASISKKRKYISSGGAGGGAGDTLAQALHEQKQAHGPPTVPAARGVVPPA